MFDGSVPGQGDRVFDGHAHDPVTQLDGSRDAEGQTIKLFINAVILKVLNGDPTVSAREIAHVAKLSASTVFYILTTRVDYLYRRYRLMPQKIDRLRQSRELLEIFQNVKRLGWRFTLTGDEF
jgi:hypothetical protein